MNVATPSSPALEASAQAEGALEILEWDLGRRAVPYLEAWEEQRRHHGLVVAGAADRVILVEHESVYTAGKRTATWDRPTDGTPVVDVDRGGRITWHGPGQLVGYPVVRLAEPIDVVRYVRQLEQAVMNTCATYGLETIRVADRSGVWLPAAGNRRERKICAIGVRVAKGVTMHGFALNCEPDLSAYDRIVPCGIDDADVTSLTAEIGHVVSVSDVVPTVIACLETSLRDVRLATTSSPAHTPAPQPILTREPV